TALRAHEWMSASTTLTAYLHQLRLSLGIGVDKCEHESVSQRSRFSLSVERRRLKKDKAGTLGMASGASAPARMQQISTPFLETRQRAFASATSLASRKACGLTRQISRHGAFLLASRKCRSSTLL